MNYEENIGSYMPHRDMRKKFSRASQILKEQGPVALLDRGGMYILRKSERGRNYIYKRSKSQIQKQIETDDSLEDYLDTVLETKPGYPPYRISVLQLRKEIEELSEIIKKQEPETVVEIGTANGGTFYIWSQYIHSVENLISIDLPGGKFGGGYDQRMAEIFRTFNKNINMTFIRNDSHKQSTFSEVSKEIEGQVDFLFIDGDHTYEGVKQDFEMYSPLVSEGGIIALHDIVDHPDESHVASRRKKEFEHVDKRHFNWGKSHPDCEVHPFWKELVDEYQTEEIISHPKQTWGGIGIVRV